MLIDRFEYDSRLSPAKDNSITQTAAPARNLDAAITARSVETELQSTIELRTTVPEIAAPNRISAPKRNRTILKPF